MEMISFQGLDFSFQIGENHKSPRVAQGISSGAVWTAGRGHGCFNAG
jgi:ribosomal protein L15